MSAVFIVLGVLVAVVLAIVGPWALLRKLEREDDGSLERSGSARDRSGKRPPEAQFRDPR